MAARKSSPLARARKMQHAAGHEGFAAISKQVAAKGAHNPDALAAFIGRKKYGRSGFAALSAAGRAKNKAKRKAT